MVENRNQAAMGRFEKCPDCGADVRLKEVTGDIRQPVLYNPDGSRHICETEERQFEKHPIGQKVTGQRVADFQLRGRVLTITLDDGNVLSVSAAGRPLSIQLSGPVGVIQE